MSVSKMKKLTVFVHRDEMDALVKKLIRLRCVDVGQADESMAQVASVRRLNCDAARSALEGSVAQINEAMTLLNPYSTKKRSLFRPRRRMDLSEFLADGSADAAREIVKRTIEIKNRRQELTAEITSLKTQILSETPYETHDIPLGMSETQRTDILLGALPASSDLDRIGRELYAAGAVAELLFSDGSGKYIAVICYKMDTDAVMTVLSTYGFVKASFKGVDALAADHIREMKKKAIALSAENEALLEEYAALSDGLEDVEVLYDLEVTNLTAVENEGKFLATDTAAMLTGWVPEEAEKRVMDALDGFACAYEIVVPHADENPPILLKNNGFAENFEWVLGMYSYPAYGKFDPTFIMSIFYFIIFGIMFADAGYGLLLILGCFGGIKLLHPSRSMERFLKMFGYCGISCIVFGVLFGAYFGDLPLAIMRNMMMIPEEELPNLALLGSSAANVAVFFDPLQNPMAFLVVSLAVGAVHLIAGMAVKFVLLCKEGQVVDAVLDIGAYWLLFLGFGLLALLPSVGLWVTIGAALLIVLTHGRSEKSIVMKILKGLLGLYDLISYASDLLSYSRILALGLAAGVIAQVVNILGTMGGPTVVGFIALVVAFLVGHLLNVAINVLGTFVHTSRLQYIEFFNKFYEDGGVAFEPMLPSDKYTEE